MKHLEALYLKPLRIMHYKSIFNALIMLRNAPYNALYDLMNNCTTLLGCIIILVNSFLHYAF